jgi:hypothetical protein
LLNPISGTIRKPRNPFYAIANARKIKSPPMKNSVRFPAISILMFTWRKKKPTLSSATICSKS